MPDPFNTSAVKTVEERKLALTQQVRSLVTQGARIESQNEFEAVVAVGQPVNHTLHAIITLFTCGLWGLVWIVLGITGGVKRQMVTVDEYGYVSVQKITTA
ncbi:hypothetical protein ACVU7I_02080 [Patulibacter sp. S7RM1-6]